MNAAWPKVLDQEAAGGPCISSSSFCRSSGPAWLSALLGTLFSWSRGFPSSICRSNRARQDAAVPGPSLTVPVIRGKARARKVRRRRHGLSVTSPAIGRWTGRSAAGTSPLICLRKRSTPTPPAEREGHGTTSPSHSHSALLSAEQPTARSCRGSPEEGVQRYPESSVPTRSFGVFWPKELLASAVSDGHPGRARPSETPSCFPNTGYRVPRTVESSSGPSARATRDAVDGW